MLAQIELTATHTAALTQLEQSTGESRSALLTRAVNDLIERYEYDTWLEHKIQRGFDDFNAGRIHTTAEVMAAAMSAIADVQAKKAKA